MKVLNLHKLEFMINENQDGTKAPPKLTLGKLWTTLDENRPSSTLWPSQRVTSAFLGIYKLQYMSYRPTTL